jgi:hypothetical protein
MRDQANEFIRSAPKDRPFCLSVTFKAPHVQDEDPRQYLPPADTESRYAGVTMPQPRGAGTDDIRRFPLAFDHSENRRRWSVRFGTPELYQASVLGYYRLITANDDVVGSVRATLRDLKLEDNTIIIYSADHGIFNGEHGFAGKWFGQEESVRTPLHVLPNGFVRIRHFGFFAHRRRAALLPLCFALLPSAEPQTAVPPSLADAARPIWTCPRCGGPMAIAERFTAAEARLRAPPSEPTHYELLFGISNCSTARSPLPTVCASYAGSSRFHLSRHGTPLQSRINVCVAPGFKDPQSYSKRITPTGQTAHFKSLYRKRSGPAPLRAPEDLSAGAFPIQP